MSAFTDVLATHGSTADFHGKVWHCVCGEQFETVAAHAAHVEVELAKAGIAITQLPEGRVINGWWEGESTAVNIDAFGPGELLRDAAAYLAAAASIPTKETPNA